MNHVRGLITTTKALQRTFFIPLIETPRPSWTRLQNTHLENQRRFVYRGARRPPPPPASKSPEGMIVDEKIKARQIQLVDEEGSIQPPTTVWNTLRTFERTDYFLVQVAPETPEKPAVCKIISKKRLREQKHEKAKASRATKQSSKQIELNWAIDPHDLSYRIKQLESFLSKGRKVELIMARKKGKRRVSEEEAQKLLATVREKVQELGATESKAMQGKPPSMVTMFVEQKGT